MRHLTMLIACLLLTSCAAVDALRFAVVAKARQETCDKVPGTDVCRYLAFTSPLVPRQSPAPAEKCGPHPDNIGGSGYQVHFRLCEP